MMPRFTGLDTRVPPLRTEPSASSVLPTCRTGFPADFGQSVEASARPAQASTAHETARYSQHPASSSSKQPSAQQRARDPLTSGIATGLEVREVLTTPVSLCPWDESRTEKIHVLQGPVWLSPEKIKEPSTEVVPDASQIVTFFTMDGTPNPWRDVYDTGVPRDSEIRPA